MKHTRRITALCAAVLLTLTGCAEKEPDFSLESDLPYGATMRSDKASFSVPMTYDRRFLEDAQVTVVADILASVQNLDADLYESCSPAYYIAYQKEVYECSETSELLEQVHSVIADASGSDFQFNMVLINEISTDLRSGGLSNAFTLLDGIYDGEGKFSASFQNAWDLTLEWDLSYDDSTQFTVMDEKHVYLFQTADGYFCVM